MPGSTEDLEGMNNRMTEEMKMLLTTLEGYLEKAKENKMKYLMEKQATDGLYDKDEGNFMKIIFRIKICPNKCDSVGKRNKENEEKPK